MAMLVLDDAELKLSVSQEQNMPPTPSFTAHIQPALQQALFSHFMLDLLVLGLWVWPTACLCEDVDATTTTRE